MPSDDLLDLAKSDVDFYAVLGVHAGSTTNEIEKAYRKMTLIYHPDKVREEDRASATEKFHGITIAKELLLDEQARHVLDTFIASREMQRRQREQLDGRRKAMVSDLEQKETGALKRKREEMDAEALQEQEIRRLQEDGRRRRMQREQELRKEKETEVAAMKEQNSEPEQPQGPVPELQRAVRVQWKREGLGRDISKEQLVKMFTRFGPIEHCMLKDKKEKKPKDEGLKKKERMMIATGLIVYESIVSAHSAFEDTKRQKGLEWDILEPVEWAEGKEPEVLASILSSPPPKDAPSTPVPASRKSQYTNGITPETPISSHRTKEGMKPGLKGEGLRKVPSFGSFKSSAFGSPINSPFGKGPNSPSLEELTLVRLKNAEKKRLEEQIRKEEAEDSRDDKDGST
ncbi:DnaJ-domain-containing protein [Tothia fuscella]|uniref:DnaJ-domain-containing protein n=1 Tax=Tothia fuscella TaxID=1048955 RepID=A0A9P4P1U7_9PEZI|nr:DnaJ-domain-containing protein [Tothia fuscella]